MIKCIVVFLLALAFATTAFAPSAISSEVSDLISFSLLPSTTIAITMCSPLFTCAPINGVSSAACGNTSPFGPLLLLLSCSINYRQYILLLHSPPLLPPASHPPSQSLPPSGVVSELIFSFPLSISSSLASNPSYDVSTTPTYVSASIISNTAAVAPSSTSISTGTSLLSPRLLLLHPPPILSVLPLFPLLSPLRLLLHPPPFPPVLLYFLNS